MTIHQHTTEYTQIRQNTVKYTKLHQNKKPKYTKIQWNSQNPENTQNSPK